MKEVRIREIRQWLADNPLTSYKELNPLRDQLMRELDALEKQAGIMSGIHEKGQKFLDAPVHTVTTAKTLDYSVAHAFGRWIPAKVAIFEGFEREHLRWLPAPNISANGATA